MTEKCYRFIIELIGYGETEKEAWEDGSEKLSYELSEGLVDFSVVCVEEA